MTTATDEADPGRNDSVVVDSLGRDALEHNATFKEWQQMSTEQALSRLKASIDGLDQAEVKARQALYGPNDINVQRRGRLISTMWFLWNPLAWMLELAVLAALIFGQWVDAAIIALMLVINALVCFYGDSVTSNAAGQLKDQLALNCHVRREGRWQEIRASDLTLGDIVSIQDGDVVPADCKLLTKGVLLCDEVALTGQEKSPNKTEGDLCFSGAAVKTGTGEAVVVAIGHDTFFASTVDMLAKRHRGRLQSIMARIGNFAIIFVMIMILLELSVQIGYRRQPWHSAIANNMVLIIGAIPIAMPAVLSVILALGAMALAKKNVIVRRLNAIEELASMDVLCANKSGTISSGQLEIITSETFPVNGHTPEEVLFYAAIAAQPEPTHIIDQIVVDACPQKDTLWTELERLHYIPSDPLQKRTIASVRVRANGNTFRSAKGAPWVMLMMDQYADLLKEQIETKISELAERGFRVVGVSVSRDPADMPMEKVHWEIVGLLALKDPPRADCASSLQAAKEVGVDVKVITGEELAAAVQTCKNLGVSSNLQTGASLEQNPDDAAIEEADGFAELYPKHKFSIVERLQKCDHVVGISGTSVNDCAALQKADIGIAVPGSVGAARSAADIVLLLPGLSVIIDAVMLSRIIFRRMHAYAMHCLVAAVQVVFTFGLLTLFYNWYFPAFCILIMVVLNDGSLLAISKDSVVPSQEPERWDLRSIFLQAFAIGAWFSLGTLLLFALARHTSIFSTLQLDSLASYGGTFTVDRGDPLCDWGLWFNPKPNTLASCPNSAVLTNPITYDRNVWRYYQQTMAEGDTTSACHQALAQAVCGVQQLRLGKLRSLVYLIVSITGQAVIFTARTKGSMWKSRPSNALIAAFAVAQLIATLLATLGFGRRFSARTYFAGVGPATALLAWIWALLLLLPVDLIKFAVQRHTERRRAAPAAAADTAE